MRIKFVSSSNDPQFSDTPGFSLSYFVLPFCNESSVITVSEFSPSPDADGELDFTFSDGSPSNTGYAVDVSAPSKKISLFSRSF